MENDPLFSLSARDAPGHDGIVLEPDALIAGKYRLLRPAGFGGMGAVWVARNEATNAEVALKVLLARGEGVDEEASLRFRREAHAAAQLYHRGIVRIFDLVELKGPDDGTLVMVMELLRGETLADLIDSHRVFSLEETLSIILPLLSALAHAHAAGIVHRDLKPENVFLAVDPDGHVTPKILDFGISKISTPQAPKITTDGVMLGTPNYMSPEQARGSSDIDARSDVFAVGILLYEMLSGQNPFASGSYHSVVAAILERDPPMLTHIPVDVWTVLNRALEKSSAKRFANASELALALRGAARRAGITPSESWARGPSVRPTSLADDTVPPAPFRERAQTIPSVHFLKRKHIRTRAVSAVVAVSALIVAAAVFRQVTREKPTSPQPTASAFSGPPPASAPLEVAQPPNSPPVPSPPVEAALPTTTAVATGRSHVGGASKTSSSHAAASLAAKAAASGTSKSASSAASHSPATPVAKSSSVLRDPGF